MKRIFCLLIASLITGLQGCRENPVDDMSGPRPVMVEIMVRPDRMMAVTRTTDETSIRDLNFYLCDDNGEIVLHRYQTSAMLRFECLPGNYRIRVAANLGFDLGNAPALEDFTVAHSDVYDILPMSWEGDVSIKSSSDGIVTLPTIEVQRCVAKVTYEIAVKPSDIELRSVQLLSVPRTTSVFDPTAAPSDNPDDYTDCKKVSLSGRQAAGSCYMLPNKQGRVPSITHQRQKNPDNAPPNASYLLIRAVRGSKVLAYYIYLGGNNTSDFNVRANVHYRLNISILGDSDVDTRVSSYSLNVHDTYAESAIGGYCTYDPSRMLAVEIDGDPAPLTLRGRIVVSKGNAEAFYLNDKPVGLGCDLTLTEQPGPNVFGLNYDPGVYTSANSQITYTVSVEDDAGFMQSFDIGHRFANRLDVYLHSAAVKNGNGSVTVTGALYNAETSSLTHDRVVLCHQMGCTLTAHPASGFRFEGWYSTADYTTRLSSSVTYSYVPKSNKEVIYPKFVANSIPLDTQATANCYIVRSLNSSYSFDATVMGNGHSTTNLWPSRLSGTSARVLWESGTLSKAVISDVKLTDGRINFTTGSQRGNALIGLFDPAGKCIWSWHIWSVDYDIGASAQTYFSGKVFMDRNLGAMTTDCTQPASRGLYYQWGRKDPFIYPATCQDERKLADAVYAAGFEYAASDPRDAGTKSPYDVMTVKWSIAHPTTYMHGVYYDDWEEWISKADWLYDSHPNLWGNRTTSSGTITRNSDKSIYDPCPAGWKVPCAEDFLGVERVGVSQPYYVTVRYNASLTTHIPLGGTFSEGYYMNNGQIGRLYANNPYHYRWSGGSTVFYDIACTSIYFSTSSVPPYIGTTDYYRYAANPIRCIRE